MQADSQAAAILADLKAGKRLTPMDALRKYGSFRLGARVFDLKQEGHEIEKEMVEVGDGKRVARYFMRVRQPSLF
jgi:hypothetical protein